MFKSPGILPGNIASRGFPTRQQAPITFSQQKRLEIFADKERIEQVKYSGNQQVTVKACEEADNILISVKDDRIGINRCDQKQVLDRFFRVNSETSKMIPGFGIGL